MVWVMPVKASALVGPLSPDLEAEIPTDLTVGASANGFRLLFSAPVRNGGSGPLLLSGRQASQAASMTVSQPVVNSDGTTQSFPEVGAFSLDDGSGEWRLQSLAHFGLRAAGKTLRSADADYCIGTADNRSSCGNGDPGLDQLEQNLPVGSSLAPRVQGIGLKGLPAGRYSLVSEVDPERGLLDADYSDNVASRRFVLRWPDGPRRAPSVSVLGGSTGTDLTAGQYDRAGPFLDYNRRPNSLRWPTLGQTVRTIDPRRGIHITTPSLDLDLYSGVEDAVYGLWHFTQFVARGNSANLVEAERAAGWLAKLQSDDGLFRYDFSYNVGGERPLVLEPGWYGVSTQALSMSLWSRLYRATGKEKYLRRARLSLRPLTSDIFHGGVASTFLDTGMLFFEGYATLGLPVHTNSHYLQAVIALYDMRDLSKTAGKLYREAVRTVTVAVPFFDLGERMNSWLAQITDPPREPQPILGGFQEQIVSELQALSSAAPDATISEYASKWDAQLIAICADPGELCQYPH